MSLGMVACDIDGVVADYIGEFLPRANKHFGRDVSYGDLRHFDIANCFGTSPEEMLQLMEKLGSPFVAGLSPIPGALEAINAIRKAGFGLALITARPDTRVTVTKQWVEKHFGPDVPVFFSRSIENPYGGRAGRPTKLELIHQLEASYFIEDNLREFNEDWPHDRVTAIGFKQPWTRDIQGDPRILLLDWPGIRELLLSRRPPRSRRHT